MTAHRRVAEIGLLVYPGAQMAAVHGLTDLFGVANRIAVELASEQLPVLRVSHWQVGDTPVRIYDSLAGEGGHLFAVLLPPSLGDELQAGDAASISRWLRERHAEGSALGSVCLGAFLLAQTGLLDGRRATTHWTQVERLQQRFPLVQVEGDKPLIDDGDLITSAGLMAWADVGLRLIDRLMGPGIARRTARFMMIEHSDSAQDYGSHFAPILDHGDAAVLKVQHWLQANGAVDVSLKAMAACALLEERTLLRRFRAATGLKPTEYCQHVRVGKARELLEFTNGTVDSIAWAVGYQDAGAFRATFKKVTGLAPSEYRARFGV
ncbi:MAG: GlxA family transcriptional regulator [Pseudomonas sp.]|nr:GlxA family transcriptional regulator [Pseudomonas sp.]